MVEGENRLRRFNQYLALVRRLSAADLNRSENDLSSNLKAALSDFGLHGVLDTGSGSNRRKRPDIALFVSLDDADAGTAADILIEAKKPHELARFTSLREALLDQELWDQKFIPYLQANVERVSYFILTTFECFLAVPISNELRRGIQTPSIYENSTVRTQALSAAVSFDIRQDDGAQALLDWCIHHIRPEAINPPNLQSLLDLRRLTNADDLENFANELADVVVGPEGRPSPGGALLSSIYLNAARLDDLPPRARSALVIYTMSAHGGMSIDETHAHLRGHLPEELAEFVGASIHSLVGRLFAVKTIEDAFCIDVEPPLLPRSLWVFHTDRFEQLSTEELPAAFFDALGALDHSTNPAVNDLAATGRFYDWLAPQIDPAAFRRLLTLFFSHSFHDLDGDLLGRFFEIYAQRLDRQRRRELGQYYTPVPIVRHMWRVALNLVRERGVTDDLLVLDPGVGSGTFLIEGARQLERAALPRFWERLHGFDIAPQVIAVAQVNLYLTVLGLLDRSQAEQVGTLNLYPTDALDPRNGAKLRSVMPLLTEESTRLFLERRIAMSEAIKRSERFPLVIGNPPYKNNSTRTLAQVADLFPALLRSSRDNARARERNIRDDYVWFFAAADFYTTDRGVIAFVVSDSFCYARSCRFFREDLLRRYRLVQLIHLGRFIFRDVGPRTSFVIVILERRATELGDAARTEEIAYIDLRPLSAAYNGTLGGADDSRLIALNSGELPEAQRHTPERQREFILFPGSEAVSKVLRAPIVVHSTTPRRVFIKKWPGVITAFDKLFKSSDRASLSNRMESFFGAAHTTGSQRRTALDRLATGIGLDDDERPRLTGLADQAVEKELQFSPEGLRRTLTGSGPNDDAWYPSQRMTAWLYYEHRLLVPRNINPGRNAGWGSMSQWREPQSHQIAPKLAFTTSTNVEAGLKAFVLTDDWVVKLGAGTRQQLNYTSVRNPLVPDSLSGPNNLGSEALEFYTDLESRGMGDEDFLLYVAGIYNSQLAEDYLEGGGGNMMHIPLDPQRLEITFVDRVIATSRRLRDLHWLSAQNIDGIGIDEALALRLATPSQLQALGFEQHHTREGRFRVRDSWRASERTSQAFIDVIAALRATLDADVEALYAAL